MLIKNCRALGEGGFTLLSRNSCCRFQRLCLVWVPHISGFYHCPVVHPLFLCSFLCLFARHSCTWWWAFFPAQVTVDRNKTAVIGKKVSLSCSYGLPEKVQLITWRHMAQGVSTDVASFAKRSDPMIEPPYQGRVWLSASLSDSQLTIQPVAVQDEGCYTCLYSTHPDGPKSSTVCLSTYGKYFFYLTIYFLRTIFIKTKIRWHAEYVQYKMEFQYCLNTLCVQWKCY